ncbi:flagellar biosynthesis anti-sigma factor FlgM [Pluralibacter gergoviae]
MKISATQYGLNVAINKAVEAGQTRPASEQAAVGRSAAVEPLPGEAQKNLNALPEVDMAKVAEMRDAISSGKITLNLDALTAAMQDYFQR